MVERVFLGAGAFTRGLVLAVRVTWLVQSHVVGTESRGWRAVNLLFLCEPPFSGSLPSRNGRLVQSHVVGGAQVVVAGALTRGMVPWQPPATRTKLPVTRADVR